MCAEPTEAACCGVRRRPSITHRAKTTPQHAAIASPVGKNFPTNSATYKFAAKRHAPTQTKVNCTGHCRRMMRAPPTAPPTDKSTAPPTDKSTARRPGTAPTGELRVPENRPRAAWEKCQKKDSAIPAAAMDFSVPKWWQCTVEVGVLPGRCGDRCAAGRRGPGFSGPSDGAGRGEHSGRVR